MENESGIEERIKEVLNTWYKDLNRDQPPAFAEVKKWYFATDEFDQEIRDKHSKDLQDVVADEGESWSKFEDGKLAVILLADQMSRNIHRKKAEAFASDHVSLKIAKEMLEGEEYQKAKFIDKQFIMLPLEHSEDIENQEKVVEHAQKYFEEYKDVSEEHKKSAQMFLDYAKQHHDIIKKFGRYPHRNDVLGRESTSEEVEYLNNAERFGQ